MRARGPGIFSCLSPLSTGLMKPHIDSDISLSAVTDVFCSLREYATKGCITVGVLQKPGALGCLK